jgi:uncharacterized protein YqjF (DUF2071 family)
MDTIFRHCFLVNFAVAPCALRRRLPNHLVPDQYGADAFVSIVITLMERMRPSFMPARLGATYTQVVYRAVVRSGGERGVAFLRSDADNAIMVAAGNAFTFFRFNRARVDWQISEGRIGFSLDPVAGEGARIIAEYDLRPESQLPASSAFGDLPTAQAFLTELYAAFGARRSGGRLEVVRIVRNPWESQVVLNHSGDYEAMHSGHLFSQSEARLDSIFYVREMKYHWHRLSVEPVAG